MSIRILLLEDTDTDAELVERALRRADLDFVLRRVQNEASFIRELRDLEPEVVLADYKLPAFDGLSALRIVREQSADLPFLIVSGTLGDEKAVEVLKLGATDYVLKDRLSRLVPAIHRARKEVEEQRARQFAQAQVERSRRLDSLGRVAGTIAHEMNNVLMLIQTAVGQFRIRKDEETVGRVSDQITQAIRRGHRITNEVTRFTSPVAPEIAPVNLPEWLGGFVGDLRPVVGIGIDLRLQTPPSTELIASSDVRQLEQVMTNLVVNARDAMPRGGRIEISLGQGSPAGPNYVEIVVSDNGTGMTPEVLAQIFEPLFTTKRAGTGLGLAVSFQMVAAQGGQMYAESEPGVGTKVHVLLPAETPP
jgi:signal transduction histidine kinase